MYLHGLRMWRPSKGRSGLHATVTAGITAGLSCGLSCMPALFVTTAPLRRHMQQLWRLITEPYRYFYLSLSNTDRTTEPKKTQEGMSNRVLTHSRSLKQSDEVMMPLFVIWEKNRRSWSTPTKLAHILTVLGRWYHKQY